jgi:inosose dehydratase
MRVGSAPDSWGVWFPDDPNQVPWSRFLDELVLAGYEWIELGPYGYLPTDPHRLHDEVDKRGLKVAGGTVPGVLHRPDARQDDVTAACNVARLTSALGGKFVVFLPDHHGALDRDSWNRMIRGLNELAQRLQEQFDTQLVLHPHADTVVETQDQVERLLTDSFVNLCLDTGHIAYRGGDTFALIEKYPERIGYVHLKQVDPKVLDQVEAEHLSFAEAVQRGVCPEPPGGIPSYEALAAALRPIDSAFKKRGEELFTIVEQDLYPCPPDVPLPIAQRTRAYLRGCGFDS